MPEKRFDDDWFIQSRHRLLETTPFAREERRHHSVHTILHTARIGGSVDPRIDDEIRRLPFRHASAVRAHMQFYRAALTATGLLPADTLVNAAVQLEWFWYNTALTAFYRDHLAHVMKVAAIGLSLLLDTDGPLADEASPFIDSVARGLANFTLGSPAIRAAARRAGVPQNTLQDPSFWSAAVVETVRIAGLLHDMAHPAVIASRMSRIAAPVRPLAPFEPTEEELCRHAVSVFGHHLLATPWSRGELPDTKGLSAADADVCAEVFLASHSLRAGYAIVRLAEDAGRVWQLSPFDAFVLEWAALAVSLHDFDKLVAPSLSYARHHPESEKLRAWLANPENADAVRPSFQRDPVSYILAFSDWLQEFGRVLGPNDIKSADADKVEAFVRYPCAAVTLRVDRREQEEATITMELGPNDGTCFGAGDWDYERINAYKQREVAWLFNEGGWLDSRGLFAKVSLEVVRNDGSGAGGRGRGTGLDPVTPKPMPVNLFYCFADEDEPLRRALEDHLASLKWQGIVADWHHRKIGDEGNWRHEADSHLMASDIVLLLISSKFMASQYCYGVELQRALEMHQAGKARVIPVLIRAVDLAYPPLTDLAMLPENGQPVTSWTNHDEAWANVAHGIRRVVEEIREKSRATR